MNGPNSHVVVDGWGRVDGCNFDSMGVHITRGVGLRDKIRRSHYALAAGCWLAGESKYTEATDGTTDGADDVDGKTVGRAEYDPASKYAAVTGPL